MALEFFNANALSGFHFRIGQIYSSAHVENKKNGINSLGFESFSKDGLDSSTVHSIQLIHYHCLFAFKMGYA